MMKIIRKNLILIFIVLVLGTLSILYFNYHSEKKVTPQQKNELVKLETYHSSEGWGYKIIKQGKTFIDQQYIPAIQGNVAFASREDAEKIGTIVKEKVIYMEVPYISIQTLDSLKIKY